MASPHRLLISSAAVLWIGLGSHARAAQVLDLYQAEVPVATQEQAASEQGFRAALKAVLVKITGSRGVDEAAAETLLNSASSYVQQFGYRDTQPMTLWVRFDGAALHEAVTEANLPVWMEERPTVLVWVAVHAGDVRYLIDEDSRKPEVRRVQAVARQRGVPILLPLLDIEDRARVSVADVLGGFDEAVLDASARYEPDATAIARAMKVRAGLWRAQWRLYFGGEPLNWDFRGASIDAVLASGMQAIADSLGARLAAIESMSAQGDLVIAVDGVDSLEDYAHVRAYLESLSLIQASRAYRIEPGYAAFWLQASGDLGAIRDAVSLGDVLEAAPPPTATMPAADRFKQGPPTLYFHLLR